MSLRAQDREFRFAGITRLDFKAIDMGRVLTAFLARLWHSGSSSRILRRIDVTVDDFLDEFKELPSAFEGFDTHADIARRWVETHLVDMVNRGRANQAVAAPRPLHGFTYRFRNPRHSRPYGADEQLYELLSNARGDSGRAALDQLKSFFFADVDPATRRASGEVTVDVETQALLRLMDQVREDAPDTSKRRDPAAPLCIGSADLLAEDVLRLLFYRPYIPRSVLVDYLEVLFSLHLALYHLRLVKLLPRLVGMASGDPICAPSRCPMRPREPRDPQGDCPHRIGLLLDVAGRAGTGGADLAEHSADTWYRRLPSFVQACVTVKKLDEFGAYLAKLGRLTRPTAGLGVNEALTLLHRRFSTDRDAYFRARLASVLEDAGPDERSAAPEVVQLLQLDLPPLDAYIEVLLVHRGDFHRRYLVECLDSLLLKNRRGALLAQAGGHRGRRRFILDTALLEVLMQIAVLREGGVHGFHTPPVRIDELLTWLRNRYGLHIDRLPDGDGFGPASIAEREALRANREAFVDRLRQCGFYRELSDAYVGQTVNPRYHIAKGRER
jgi:hypothetical protein